MKSQKVSTNMVKREENDSGLNLCRAFKGRPSMNRVKINHFRIQRKCCIPIKFVVSLIKFVNDCRNEKTYDIKYRSVHCYYGLIPKLKLK